MIYGNIILEQKNKNLDNLLSPITIMEEYYQNEIELLNSTIEYQNSIIGGGVITESDLEYLNEGFVGNIIDKIKEMVRKFIDWVKNVFRSVKELFSKKSKDTKTEVEQVKKEVKKIEQDPNLDKNEKEIKKQKAVEKLVKHPKEDTTSSKKSTSETKEKETLKLSNTDKYEKDSEIKLLPAPKPKKYRYIHDITYTVIRVIAFDDYNTKFDYLAGSVDIYEPGDKINFEYANRRLDSIKFDKSANECWNLVKSQFTREKNLTPDKIIDIIESNTDNFNHYRQIVDDMENDNNKFIAKLKKIINSLDKRTINENLTLYYSLINKAINLSKQYTQINLQIVGLYAKDLKPVEIE